MKRSKFSSAGLLLAALIPLIGLAGTTGHALASRNRAATSILLRPSTAHGDVVYGSGYYQITVRPGSTMQLYAFVGNAGQSQQGIDLVPVDATSGEYGAISYDLPWQKRSLVGAWVNLSHKWVGLNADQGAVVPFSVHVPLKTQPGQYVGALTAFVPASRTAISQRVGLTVQTRVFDAIVVTVPGRPHAALKVVDVVAKYRSRQVYALIHIKNTGGILLKAHGYLWIYGLRSKRLWIHRSIFVDTTVPHSSVHFPVKWSKHVPAGRYRYAVSLSWGAGSLQSDGDTHATLSWHSGHTLMHGHVRAP